jgi:zinc-ribbon domain
MSSETSTDAGRLAGPDKVRPTVGPYKVGPEGGSSELQSWQLFTLAGLIGATIVVFFSKGESPAAVILLSLTIFAAAALGVAALRTVGPLFGLLSRDAPHLLGGRTRVALEREKALVLRSIKELEFDRAMGKVSEKDFVDMSARLRARAARLIRQLDAKTGYREQIEQEIEKRVGSAKVAGASSAPRAAAAINACPSCGTQNDRDARFCKNCGGRLEAGS